MMILTEISHMTNSTFNANDVFWWLKNNVKILFCIHEHEGELAGHLMVLQPSYYLLNINLKT